MAAIDTVIAELEAEITRDSDVNSSAATLLKTLFDEVEANKTNPARIQAIVDRVRANSDALATAVAANTPAAGGGGGGNPSEPLVASYANRGEFDTAVAAYTGQAVNLDGVQLKAGTAPALDYFTHSVGGAVDTMGPTS